MPSGPIAFELFVFLIFSSVMDVVKLIGGSVVGFWMFLSRLRLCWVWWTFADGVYCVFRPFAIFLRSCCGLLLK